MTPMTGTVGTFVTGANLPAITGWIAAARTACQNYTISGNPDSLRGALVQLEPLLHPLPKGSQIASKLNRLISGRGAVSDTHVLRALARIEGIVSRQRVSKTHEQPPAQKLGGSGILTRRPGTAAIEVDMSAPPYIPRPDQKEIVRRIVRHFSTASSREGGKPKRAIYCEHTGLGKSLEYAFIARELFKEMPEIFGNAVAVIGCHQTEPTEDLARQIKAVFPDEGVLFIRGDAKIEDLKGIRFVIGTYQQLAQEKTVRLLKEWAGKRRILFVNDEADKVVFKGMYVDEDGVPVDDWHAAWFQPLIEFGLYNVLGVYDRRMRHYRLGASASLIRHDGRSLAREWGRGNCVYHRPMAWAIAQGLMVPFIGKVIELDLPQGADLREIPKDMFRFTEDGRVVIDKTKVTQASESIFAVKTAVRAAVDHMLMEVGSGKQKDLAAHKAIGFASNTHMVEKHMRWQQDLFNLMEVVFHIRNGLSAANEMGVKAIESRMGTLGRKKGEDGIDAFGRELNRFLYSWEWATLGKQWESVAGRLRRNRKEGIRDFFDTLYSVLNVEVRRVKGRPLVASAVWMHMEKDKDGKRITARSPSPTAARLKYPNRDWPNRFGDRRTTMQASRRGDIDILWNIKILGRGWNDPMISLIIDNAPSDSWSEVLQRVGRAGRVPDGRNPRDHSRKPYSMYITLTPNLIIHRLDLSKKDLARINGEEVDAETNDIHITGHMPPGKPLWQTPDRLQLDLKDGKTVHVVLVGANTAKAVKDFLIKKYGDDFDPEIAAFDAGIDNPDEVAHLVMAARFPKEKKLRKYLRRWGADDDIIARIMAIYYADLAEMKTVYGGFWRVVRQGEAA